jgi:hypothetical protein
MGHHIAYARATTALGRPLRVEEVFKRPVGDSILSEYSDKHFLPAYRWVLIGNTYEPSRSPDASFFDQAENRLFPVLFRKSRRCASQPNPHYFSKCGRQTSPVLVPNPVFPLNPSTR